MTPFQRDIEATLAQIRNPMNTNPDEVKVAVNRAGHSANLAIIVALQNLNAAPPDTIDVVTVTAALTAAGVPTLHPEFVQNIIDALKGTPTVPMPTVPPTPTTPPTTLKSRLLTRRVAIPTLIGIVLGLQLGFALALPWFWTLAVTVGIVAMLAKAALSDKVSTFGLGLRCVTAVFLVGSVSYLGQGLAVVQQWRQNQDVKKAVGTDPVTPQPDNNGNGTTTPTKATPPTPVDAKLQKADAEAAQVAIDLLKPLGGEHGGKALVDELRERFAKVEADDAAANKVLFTNDALFTEFKNLRDVKKRHTKREALEQLAQATQIQTSIATGFYDSQAVPRQLETLTGWAKAQTDLIKADSQELASIEARIKAMGKPAVAPKETDAEAAKRERDRLAKEELRLKEEARLQKVATARAAVLDYTDAPEFKQMVALVVKGDRKTVVNGNDERLLLAWNVHFLSSLKGPDDVKTKLAYCLQYLPTSASTLEGKGKKDFGVDAKEWAAGPIPSETLKWAYLVAPYPTDSTWTAYAQPSGKGEGLYQMLDLQFRGKYAEKLNKLNGELPEDERVRSLADLLWVAVQAREDMWLSKEDVENLRRDPTLKNAALWTEATVAGYSSTPRTFMDRDKWCKRPETKR